MDREKALKVFELLVEIQREDHAREYLEERVACAKIRRKAKEVFVKRFAKRR